MFSKIKKFLQKYGWREFVQYVDAFYGLGAIETLIATNWFNPLLTIYFNLRSLPLHQAWQLPIFVYGRPRIYSLSGQIRFEGQPVRMGMVKFNFVKHGAPSLATMQSEINNKGTIILRGRGEFTAGVAIKVSFGARLEIGDRFRVGDMCSIIVSTKVILGDVCRIAHRSQIIDSNFHFVANFKTKQVPHYAAPIILGRNCWICNSSTVVGGARLPDYSILGSNSLLNKDLAGAPMYSLFAGAPARFITDGVVRVEQKRLLRQIYQHYADSATFYTLEEGVTIEDISSFDD